MAGPSGASESGLRHWSAVTDDRTLLERRFHGAMIEIYENAKRDTGYVATRFIQMVSERGGLETARHLLATSAVSDGFTTLWDKGRLDLTVEAHVLQSDFRPLFTEAELATARERLAAYGWRGADAGE